MSAPPSAPGAFDPYAILHALEAERAFYIVVGGLARVLHGSDEITDGVDVAPSLRAENLERLGRALVALDAAPRNGASLADVAADPERVPILAYDSPAGQIKVVGWPAGTRGYDDLRWKASWLHVGEGLRLQVAAPGDLVRMQEALDLPGRSRALGAMRRVVELDRGRGLER